MKGRYITMAMNIVQFNEKFKQYMNDVRIIEKTHPRESINLWLKICQFIINFAKSPNCPINLRKKLIIQAEIIVQKVKSFNKGEISSVFDTKVPPKPSKSPETEEKLNIPFASKGSPPEAGTITEDEMLKQLMSLPDTPIDTNEEGNRISPTSTSKIPPSEGKGDIISSQEHFEENQDDLSKLQKLEETLKQMPKNFKEIKPLPFSSTSVIPELRPDSNQINLDEFKKDTQTLDITSSVPNVSDESPDLEQLTNSLNNKKNLSIAGFESDPFKQTAQKEENTDGKPHIPDPFGPKAVSDESTMKIAKRTCFACGAILKEDVSICPSCGADNKE